MKIYLNYFSFIVLILSCDNSQNESIILTSGRSMNPDTPRFGIEIQNDVLYYCEETKGGNEHYNYYSARIGSELFLIIKNNIKENFKNYSSDNEVVDATPFELIYKTNEETDTILFYHNFLSDKQIEIIEEIISLKNNKLQKINYHSFPQKLLTEKLPDPPPLKNK